MESESSEEENGIDNVEEIQHIMFYQRLTNLIRE